MIELYTTSLHNNKPDQSKGMLSQIILSAPLESFPQELLLTPVPTNILGQAERPPTSTNVAYEEEHTDL